MWAAAVLALLGVLYGITLYPGVGGRINPGDSAKFQYVGKILGVPHQPGYPQYVLINHLWTRLPLGLDLARQVNLLSAVLALGAGLVLFAGLRELSGSHAAAALGTLTVLASRAVWTSATEAEVHSLHLFYVAALLWVAARWRAHPSVGRGLTLVALFAAGCGNHPLMAAFVPGLVLLLAGEWRQTLQPRFILAGLLLLCLGASQYGYLLWRAHSGAELLEAVPPGADGADLLLAMSGFRFASAHLEAEITPANPRLSAIARAALAQLPAACLLLAPVGAAALWRRDRRLAGFALLTLLAGVLFLLVYRIGDWGPYLGPVWVWTVALGVVGWTRSGMPRWLQRGLAALWVVQLAIMASANFERLRVRENPNDRSWLVESAGADALVLAYGGKGYRETQLARYYALGLGMPRVTTARQTLEERWLFLEDRPLVFADRAAREVADAHRVEYLGRIVPGPPQRTIFTTGTEWALRSLLVVPEAGGASVRRPEGQVLLEAGRPLQVLVVSGRDRRVKGVMSWPLSTSPERLQALRDLPAFLGRVLPGDYVCVLLQASSRLGDTPGLREAARDVLQLPVEAEAARVAMLAGPSRGLQLALDPATPLTLEIVP